MKIESNQQYFDVCFDKQDLLTSDLLETEFEECEFNDCDFSSTVFRGCKFLNCSFNRCNLSLIKVPHSRFFDVNFVECKLLGIDWTVAYWPTFHLDAELKFYKCILSDGSFFGLTLNELIFEECKLHDVDLREGDFANSSMTYCDFANSLFMRTNLQHVDFSESSHFDIDVLENNIAKATFSRYEALNLLSSLDITLVD
ncbi:MAG: pentapeptide repeat-containing protein [Psychromonas sp.]